MYHICTDLDHINQQIILVFSITNKIRKKIIGNVVNYVKYDLFCYKLCATNLPFI